MRKITTLIVAFTLLVVMAGGLFNLTTTTSAESEVQAGGPVVEYGPYECLVEQVPHVCAETSAGTTVLTQGIEPVLSPDGEKIAYTRDGGDIYMMNRDGSEPELLVWQMAAQDLAWGANGIVFVGVATNAVGPQIWWFDPYAEFKITLRLTNDTSFKFYPTWSPDGSEIVYASTLAESGGLDLWIVDFETQELIRVTQLVGGEFRPAWSPDGTRIAFYRTHGGDSEIWVLERNALETRQLTTTEEPSESPLSWSPDGTRIAFVSDRDGNDEIYVMNKDGSEQTRWTNNGARDWQPRWVDDTTLAFRSDRAGTTGRKVFQLSQPEDQGNEIEVYLPLVVR